MIPWPLVTLVGALVLWAISLIESWWVRTLRPDFVCRCRMFFGTKRGWRWWTR